MFVTRVAALVVGVLVVLAGGGAFAHDPETSREPDATEGSELTVSVQIDPTDAAPPVVTVPLGAHVRLNMAGAGAAELHLHGYDVEASGGDRRKVLVFHAAHEGRFPVAAHIEDALLGQRDRPVLFVEVRAP